MPGRKFIVIVDCGPDGDHVAEWQRQALATLPPEDSLELLACNNTSLARKPVKHGLYYALNLLSVRNPLTRSVPLAGIRAQVCGRREFASLPDGAWQVLPEEIVTYIAGSDAQAVIKLGMGLMRVPPEIALPILSWHHGDPEYYRGRPAGFWEIRQRRGTTGQIVQAIGNKLDAGAILAFAETRTLAHSWRGTLMEGFRHSPLLLEPALRNALAGTALTKPTTGKNYRLPSNFEVLRFGLQMFAAKLRRWVYGALFEKRWQVSTLPITGAAEAVAILTGAGAVPDASSWEQLPVPKGCTFNADPFYAPNGDLLVEALSARSGRGELHRIGTAGSAKLSVNPGHHSYPAMVEEAGQWYCVPEIAQWSGPVAYRIVGDSLEPAATLQIEGSPRLTDPTFLRHDSKLYLLGNVASEGSNVLRLWSADGLFAPFTEHPSSPVRISPRGGRMGGNIIADGKRLVRVGQDFTRDYGDGLILFEIDELTPETYREHEAGQFRFTDRHGPHTANLSPSSDRLVIDWYHNRFTALAGVRRALARLRRT